MAGAATILAAGYTWYHFSGVKKIVDRIQETKFYLDQARDNLSKGKLPSQTLGFLREAVKAYLAFPGSNFVVDKAFDVVDGAVDAHADEANAIIATAYTKIRDLIQQGGDKHVTQRTVQILSLLRDLREQLQPASLELRQRVEKYEVKKRVNEALAAAATLGAATMEKIPDLYDRFRPQVRLSWHICRYFR
ncbi:hypothetical protein BYT27DRAFT_7180416 [Phlegmacium glaucopus]|nr:hypothetical protein BYT27DRAFT_7180416 [Phlegmacium glaucopus]